MHFPTFPVFRKLIPEDREQYLRVYNQVDPYSDFSFNNLLIWLDINNDLEVSQYKDNLIFRFSNVFEDKEKSYTLLGNKDCRETIYILFDFLTSNNDDAKLSMVPECVLDDALQGDKPPLDLVITANPGQRDYIFNVKNSINMPGKKYMKLRNSHNAFIKNNGAVVTCRPLDLNSSKVRQDIINCIELWHEKNGYNDPRRYEIDAIKRYLNYIEWAPAESLGVFFNNKLVGFSIYQLLTQPGWAILNHIKYDSSIKDLFDFIYIATLRELAKKDISSVNLEQDLGLEGLRLHKNKLRPDRFLYRYDISRV